MKASDATGISIDITEIMARIPHRYPMLLIDRCEDFRPNQSIIGCKAVTYNEPYFQGHFPDFPVMPGVLIIEAMAQAAGTLAIVSHGGRQDDEIYFFVGIDKARFKRQVVPGDQLTFEIELITQKRDIGKFKAVAKVDGQVAAEAEIMCARRKVDM